jgi:excisionase family DNA binding protein
MVMSSPDHEWITIAEAVDAAGCTDGYLRRLLRQGRLEGWRAGERAWLVRRDAISELRGQLSTRSNLRAHERKSLKKKPKRSR